MFFVDKKIREVLLNILDQLDFFVFFAVIFALPFGKSIFVPILFGWLCSVLLSYFVKRDYSFDRFKGLLILPILLYLLHINGVVQSANLEGGLFDMQMKLSLLLLPLLYPYQRETYKLNRRNFFWAFIGGSVTAFVFYTGNAFYRSYLLINGVWVFNPVIPNSWNNYFLGTNFSILIHPSYLALYFLVVILFIGIEVCNGRKKQLTIVISLILVALISIVALVLLQSRAGFLGLGLLALVLLYYLVCVKHQYIVGVSIIIVFLFFSYYIFTKFSRFEYTAQSLETTLVVGFKSQNKEDGTAIRFWIWKSAITVIQEQPIFGVGTGDIRAEMKKQFEDLGMVNATKESLNAHNQYLETWLGVGIFGFLALLAMLIVPLWLGIRRHDWLLVGFICLCGTSFLFESMLNSIAGVGFFAIFYTMLVSREADSSKPLAVSR